ncbi:MAG: acetyl ornithine aminotransferase family protein [Acidobacteria bacterium]|nr:acetyl ornithine aminotransferase family protein [Acidobacteriota bacterium]
MSKPISSSRPSIVTELPGPEARRVIADDQKWVSQSYTRPYPLVVKRGSGAMLEDVDGNTFLDFNAGVAVCSTGHAHPEVIEAIKRQADEFLHICAADYYYPHLPALGKKLEEIAPGDHERRVHFGNSGAEAVEGCAKAAIYATGRNKFIGFYSAFHGRTLGALSFTASKNVQRRGFGPQVLDVTHVPYPNCLRCPFGKKVENCGVECVKFIRDTVMETTVPAEDCAGIVLEPIQGEGGYIVPPQKFVDALVDLAKEKNVLVICDEVQSGMGRTGRMWASDHFGLVPDLFSTAKGIASGMPLSATVARKDLMNWHVGAHASTFGGNPVAIAASLKTIELLENGLIDNAAKQGEYLMEGLRRLQAKYVNHVLDVRGRGLMVGMELVRTIDGMEPIGEERDRVVEEAFKRGLIIIGCGASTVRFSPPLVIGSDDVDFALEVLDESMAAVFTS